MKPLLFSTLILLLAGCQMARKPDAVQPNPDARNNAVSLLYDLLSDEKNVSKLLIIKRDRPELREVIRQISSTAGTAQKTLEKFAREDATLHLKSTALPPGDQAARDLQGKIRAGELLRASGADFEFKLLLTQAEALGYAETLARVASQHEPLPERANAFAEISQRMKALRNDVLKLLRSPPPPD